MYFECGNIHLIFFHRFEYSKNSDISHESAIKYGTLIFILIILSGLCATHSYFKGIHFAVRVRAAVCNIIYRKALRLSAKSLVETAPGKLVNLLSNDVSRFETVSLLFHRMWTSPIITFIAGYFLWVEIRWAGIIGIFIVLLSVFIQSMFTSI